jgi:hypothetical protein
MKVKVTKENLEHVRETIGALDQRAELVAGCETWTIPHGQMTVWPEDCRGAIAWGSDSHWGDWFDGMLHLDNGDTFNAEGERQ